MPEATRGQSDGAHRMFRILSMITFEIGCFGSRCPRCGYEISAVRKTTAKNTTSCRAVGRAMLCCKSRDRASCEWTMIRERDRERVRFSEVVAGLKQGG